MDGDIAGRSRKKSLSQRAAPPHSCPWISKNPDPRLTPFPRRIASRNCATGQQVTKAQTRDRSPWNAVRCRRWNGAEGRAGRTRPALPTDAPRSPQSSRLESPDRTEEADAYLREAKAWWVPKSAWEPLCLILLDASMCVRGCGCFSERGIV